MLPRCLAGALLGAAGRRAPPSALQGGIGLLAFSSAPKPGAISDDDTSPMATSGVASTSPTPGPAPAGAGAAAAQTPLMRHLHAKIMMRGGPISLAEFMNEALTSPHGGFYMSKDVFGSAGDFITSPEISQMFGEMVGAWVAHAWQEALGCPARLALVELGPGRGTLMSDILRATARFAAFRSALEVHLVEVSPALRRLQWQALRCTPGKGAAVQALAAAPLVGSSGGGGGDVPQAGVSGINGAEVAWHHVLDSVPRTMPAIFIAHEFFDALPVHQFVKDPQRGWLEKLVDIDDAAGPPPSSSSSSVPPQPPAAPSSPPAKGTHATQHRAAQPRHPRDPGLADQHATATASAHHGPPAPTTPPAALASSAGQSQDEGAQLGGSQAVAEGSVRGSGLRLVLSPHATPAVALLVKRRLSAMGAEEAARTTALEVSAHGMAAAEALALRVGQQGGAALLVDYGQDGPYADSLMAIKQHKGVAVLEEPGTADLSAWVDFAALRHAAVASGAPVAVTGPVTQSHFLLQLGMRQRLDALLKRATPAQAEELRAGFERLTDERLDHPGAMGGTYKVMAISRAGQPLPVGFDGGPVATAASAAPPAPSPGPSG